MALSFGFVLRLVIVIHLVHMLLVSVILHLISLSLKFSPFSYIIRLYSTFVVNFEHFVEFCRLASSIGPIFVYICSLHPYLHYLASSPSLCPISH